jgi:hypothetical protein
VRLLGHRQGGVGVATLGGDHAAPGVHRAAVLQSGADVLATATSGLEHLLGETDGEFDDVGRTTTGEHLDGPRTSSALPAVRPREPPCW